MANQTRKKSSAISGLVDNTPLTNSGTSLVATELAGLPAVDATEHMVIVLDPLGAGNGPEIVYVTAHTAASTGATIVRGREGTSGVSHTSSMTWVHGPTPADFLTACTAATRPSGTGLPYQGQMIYETDTDILYRYNGTAWTVIASVEQTYTPTLTQPSAVTKTVSEATYQLTSNRAYGNVKLTLTAAGTTGNTILVGLPVAHAHPVNTNIGGFTYNSVSAGLNYAGSLMTASASGGTTGYLIRNDHGNALGTGDSAYAMASTDFVTYDFNYKTT